MPPDDRFPNPDLMLARYVRRAAASAAAPDPQAALSAAARGSGRVDVGDLSAADLREFELQRELKRAQDRLKHLEQALRTAGRVLQPYLAGGGR